MFPSNWNKQIIEDFPLQFFRFDQFQLHLFVSKKICESTKSESQVKANIILKGNI